MLKRNQSHIFENHVVSALAKKVSVYMSIMYIYEIGFYQRFGLDGFCGEEMDRTVSLFLMRVIFTRITFDAINLC